MLLTKKPCPLLALGNIHFAKGIDQFFDPFEIQGNIKQGGHSPNNHHIEKKRADLHAEQALLRRKELGSVIHQAFWLSFLVYGVDLLNYLPIILNPAIFCVYIFYQVRQAFIVIPVLHQVNVEPAFLIEGHLSLNQADIFIINLLIVFSVLFEIIFQTFTGQFRIF